MKELLVISGKGGTGKTSIVGAFAALSRNAVLADCDVDAADLHLLLQPRVEHIQEFYGGLQPELDWERCDACGQCREACRYRAISQALRIDPLACEGCGVCSHVCPRQAIAMRAKLSGQWLLSATPYGPLVHARMELGAENSGKLVARVRQEAKLLALKEERELIITDGPPGLGCPVISAITGVDLALVVTEPTISGLHDLDRVLDLARHFGTKAVVCLNKWDLAPAQADAIAAYCQGRGVAVAARIPYDADVFRSVATGRPLVEISNGSAARAVAALWAELGDRYLS